MSNHSATKITTTKNIGRLASSVFKPAHTILASCKVRVICYRPIFEQGTVVPGNLGRVVRLILSTADRISEQSDPGGLTTIHGKNKSEGVLPKPKFSGNDGPGRL